MVPSEVKDGKDNLDLEHKIKLYDCFILSNMDDNKNYSSGNFFENLNDILNFDIKKPKNSHYYYGDNTCYFNKNKDEENKFI